MCGRVVGGLEVLSLMERVTTNDEDRPLQVGMVCGLILTVQGSWGPKLFSITGTLQLSW
jgi:hypothetical protein